MAADDKIMEALARIEHKVDLALSFAGAAANYNSMLPTVGSPNHVCPICVQVVEYQIDINNAVVIRKCGCSTGKIPLDLKAFAPQLTKKKEEDNGRDEEDRSDTNSGIRGPGRR